MDSDSSFSLPDLDEEKLIAEQIVCGYCKKTYDKLIEGIDLTNNKIKELVIKMHTQSCPLRPCICDNCGCQLLSNELADHYKKCKIPQKEYLAICDICHKQMTRSLLKPHKMLGLCKHQLNYCNKCNIIFTDFNDEQFAEHIKTHGIETVESNPKEIMK